MNNVLHEGYTNWQISLFGMEFKKKKKTQHATGEQDAKSKTRILVQISYFFLHCFKTRGYNACLVPGFTKNSVFW